MAQKFRTQGEDLEKSAFADRKAYVENPELVNQQRKADSAVNAPDSVEQAMRADNANLASQEASQIDRYATSSSAAIAGATLAVQQQQKGNTQAAVAGAQHHQQLVQNQMVATEETNKAKDQAYELNVQQPFELNYNKAMSLQTAGIQGLIDAQDQKAQAWANGFVGIAKSGETMSQGTF